MAWGSSNWHILVLSKHKITVIRQVRGQMHSEKSECEVKHFLTARRN